MTVNFPLDIDRIFKKSGPGTVRIDYPEIVNGNVERKTLVGITHTDSKMTLRNKWEPLVPQIDTLSKLSQIAGSPNVASFLSATQAGWGGTDPISIPVSFYLFSYTRGVNIKEQVSGLMKLGALDVKEEGSMTAVKIHGGYSVRHFQFNDNLIKNSLDENTNRGRVSISMGGMYRLSNLILEEITVEYSDIQVAQGVPLFIKVDSQFRTSRAADTSIIRDMYTL